MITYRHLTKQEEFDQVMRVQQEIWGFADAEAIPKRLFLIASKIGGQVIGAFDGARLVGYCFAIPGLKQGRETYLHSHMTGVLPEYRNRRIGREIKLAQRQDALRRGIRLIEWTFDPLELKNAHFNVERLGVIVRRYIPNNYGITTSKLHTGLPTDRCVAEWLLDHPRTEAILAGEPRQRELVEERIEIPLAIETLRRERMEEARAIQQEAGARFIDCFDRGLAVTGFERSDSAGTYLLSRWA